MITDYEPSFNPTDFSAINSIGICTSCGYSPDEKSVVVVYCGHYF
jgi:hypothetical protein